MKKSRDILFKVAPFHTEYSIGKMYWKKLFSPLLKQLEDF